jgi:hypothetical protein
LGLAARANRRKYAMLGYFFGPLLSAPSLARAERLRAPDAVFIAIASDLGVREGSWLRLGRLPGWESARDDWPMPVFVRQDPILKNGYYLTWYDPDDPSESIRDEFMQTETRPPGPSDGSWGSSAVGIRLAQLLRSPGQGTVTADGVNEATAATGPVPGW